MIKASQMGEEMQSQAVRVAQDGMGLCNTENVRGRRARALGGRARRRAETRADTAPVRSRSRSRRRSRATSRSPSRTPTRACARVLDPRLPSRKASRAHSRLRAPSTHNRGNWHVFCGRNVASCVTHEAGKFIYFYLGQTGFIIFATA